MPDPSEQPIPRVEAPVAEVIGQNVSVLLVEDDDLLRAALIPWLQRLGCEVRAAATAGEALTYLEHFYYDLLLLDLQLPDGNGLSLLEQFETMVDPPTPILLTGTATIDAAVRAMRLGAVDIIEKPVAGPDLAKRLADAIEAVRARRAPAAGVETSDVVAESPSMRAALEAVLKLASAPRAPVLLVGESGTGKQMFARLLHGRSRRSSGPFVEFRVGTVPSYEVAPVLFGALAPESWPGWLQRRGLVPKAGGGTLFISEIGDLDHVAQAQLVTLIEDGSFMPLGSDRQCTADVRIVAATTSNPEDLVAAGALDRHLAELLSVGLVAVPPLRHRLEDIRPLAHRFLEAAARELEKPELQLSPEALSALDIHLWHGNVRELREAMIRAAAHATSPLVDVKTLGLPEPGLDAVSLADATKDAIEDIEKAHIRRVMHLAGGSPSKAAQMLGISRSTLWRKLKQYGLS